MGDADRARGSGRSSSGWSRRLLSAGAGGRSAARARSGTASVSGSRPWRRVEDAVLSFAYEDAVPDLAKRAWHVRGFGDFWAHMLVAEGAVDGAVDAVGVSEWDLAACR